MMPIDVSRKAPGATFTALFLFALAAFAETPRHVENYLAIKSAHSEIWRRFIDEHHIFHDFADFDGKAPIPTPDECREGKPNALGWWTPIENGAMFNGMYLDGMCNRWKLTQKPEDAEKARQIAAGLIYLALISKTPGFIARGVGTDGVCHYPMGSNDQTLPWFYGLWRYANSGIPDEAERAKIVAKMVEVAEALQAHGWRMPCDAAPFTYRGSFAPIAWEAAPRLLFLFKALGQLTGQKKWDILYQDALQETQNAEPQTRLEACRKGMDFAPKYRHAWTGATSVSALRGLWELERDERLKSAYAEGLRASAAFASESLQLYRGFDNDARQTFVLDWRVMNQWWKPQANEAQAVEVALDQIRKFTKLAPRRHQETLHMREPLFAAWMITLCPDPAILERHRSEILAAVRHYRYDRLYYSLFFPAELAWYQMQIDKQMPN